MRTLALLGGAELTRGAVANSRADEIWTLNWFYRYDWVPRVDRLFEMHPIWQYAMTDRATWKKPRDHWEWLQQHTGYPVYMLADLSHIIPACISYPLEMVSNDLFGNRLWLGENLQGDWYSSSFAYMLALAIYERWDIIELYGWEMGTETEYFYQRENAAFFIGLALGRGLTIRRPANTTLGRGTLYGYTRAQMIFRQDIERMLHEWEEKRTNEMARLQHTEGQLNALQNTNAAQELIESKWDEVIEQNRKSAGAATVVEFIRFLLSDIDLKEADLSGMPVMKVERIPQNGNRHNHVLEVQNGVIGHRTRA